MKPDFDWHQLIVGGIISVASGPGTIAALLACLVFGGITYAAALLTHGVTDHEAAVSATKAGVFGCWVGYTPFAIYSIVKWLVFRQL